MFYKTITITTAPLKLWHHKYLYIIIKLLNLSLLLYTACTVAATLPTHTKYYTTTPDTTDTSKLKQMINLRNIEVNIEHIPYPWKSEIWDRR